MNINSTVLNESIDDDHILNIEGKNVIRVHNNSNRSFINASPAPKLNNFMTGDKKKSPSKSTKHRGNFQR